MAETKKPMWKRWWFWALTVIVLAVISSSASGNKDSNTQTVTADQSPAATTATATPKTETLTITNSTYTAQGSGLYKVDGEVKNNDSSEHSATLKATFYDADGKIMGTASGAVNNIAAGDTKTFTLIGTDKVSGYKTMKVQVDTLL
jgi:hypothetical protein